MQPGKEAPETATQLVPPQIVPKPHVRILSTHNLSRQFQYEQRHMTLKVTEQAHAAIKQIAEAWHIGIPVYLSYAVMAQLERDCGMKFKWLDPAKGERAPESLFPDVMPSPDKPTKAPGVRMVIDCTPTFDPLSML